MDYIFKPMSYVLVIMLGYLLKRAGFFGKDDHRLMSKIMVNITLPCTIIQAFDGFERDTKMFIIVGIGFICAFVPILLMYLTTGRVEKRLRAYRMLNIGSAAGAGVFRQHGRCGGLHVRHGQRDHDDRRRVCDDFHAAQNGRRGARERRRCFAEIRQVAAV